MINPERMALKRRASVYKEGKLLLSNFEGSEQLEDLKKTKGHVQGALEQFYRVKTNVKDEPMKEFYETGNPRVLMFDFNWWPLTRMQGRQEDYNNVFVYQLKGCNVACNFCFVDYFNNNGQVSHGAKFFSVEEIVEVFVKKREELKKQGKTVNVLRASGGEPSLVPEQWLALLQEIDKRSLSNEVYVQSDTNLTTGRVLDALMEKGEIDKHILEKIAEYDNFGLLSCFKGTDPEGFSEMTRCGPEFFEDTFYSLKKLTDAGIAVYPHVINPNPNTLEALMKRLELMYGPEAYPLMHVFNIGAYGPVKQRLKTEGKAIVEKALEKLHGKLSPEMLTLNEDFLKSFPEEHLEGTAMEWKVNTRIGEDILDRLVKERYGIGYKRASRPLLVERLYRKQKASS